MSRRNISVIIVVTLVSAACYLRADHNRYGRYLTQALNAIDRWALEPVPQRDLFDAAMRGIVGQLDEYSSYISGPDAATFEADLEQQFGGIGVIVQLLGDPPQLTVVSPPRFGSPALKAGLRVQDKILAIDGVHTTSMSIEQILGRMRGKTGTPVELTVLHEGHDEPLRLSIVRATIDIPSVLGDRWRGAGTWHYQLREDQRIAYLRIVNFGEKTVAELRTVLAELRRGSVQALILDLRDNAGGLLTAAVATCELFLPAGSTIVSVRGRDGALQEAFVSGGPGMVTDWPLVALVNRYTASASEIVAACLQDHGRAVVVGERTWGKGTVQHVIPMVGGRSLLKLTAASYWRPSGRNIHRLEQPQGATWGVLPDPGLAFPLSDTEQDELRADRRRRDLLGADSVLVDTAQVDDRVLTKAVEYLHGILTTRRPTAAPSPAAAGRDPQG